MKSKLVFFGLMIFVAVTFVSAQGLKVDPGTCVKVETGTTLDISGGGDLYLESDASGDASLIDLGIVSYTGGGEAKVERFLTNGKWHLVSSPVAGVVSVQYETDYFQIHSETTNGWTDISSLTYGLVPAQGYALWTVDADPTTELFTGSTYTGSQNYNFTQNGEGFNLVGNPYPSMLNWDEVSIPAELSGAIWLFDPTVGTNGDYKYYIYGGGVLNTTTQYVPSGQGFFVKATGGTGTLTFNNDDRAHSAQLFYKGTQSAGQLLIKTSGINITTQTAIRFIPEASSKVDRLFDVNRITTNSPDVPLVYTLCEGEKMAINTLPEISGHETVPLYFEAGMSGSYSFSVTELETINGDVPVYLEDVSLKSFQNLRLNPGYSFTYKTGEVKPFNIHFKDIADLDDSGNSEIVFQTFFHDGLLSVNYLGKTPFEGEAYISIYNLTGQQVLTTKYENANVEIPFAGSDAMYIVRINYRQSIFSNKVLNQ